LPQAEFAFFVRYYGQNTLFFSSYKIMLMFPLLNAVCRGDSHFKGDSIFVCDMTFSQEQAGENCKSLENY